MNILRGPECAIGNIDVQGKSSGRTTQGGVERTKTDTGVDTTHSLNNIIKRMTLSTLSEEGALDTGVLVRRVLADKVIHKVDSLETVGIEWSLAVQEGIEDGQTDDLGGLEVEANMVGMIRVGVAASLSIHINNHADLFNRESTPSNLVAVPKPRAVDH